MVKLTQMRVFLRTIYFSIFSIFFAFSPFNVQASVVTDTTSNIVDFYTYSTTSLLKATGKSVQNVIVFYKPLAVSSVDNFQNIFHTAFIASDSILNGLISVGKGVEKASEYSVVRTGEGLGNTVAGASVAISKIPNLNIGSSLNDFVSEIINVHSNIGNGVLRSFANVGNSAVEVTASGYDAFRNIHIGYMPSPIDLSKKVWNVFSSLGNAILESSEHVVTKTGDKYGSAFEVVDSNFDEATVALGNAGYLGVANIFTASNIISKNILGVEEFFVDGVARGVTGSSKQVAGIGSIFSSVMNKLSDSLVPLFTDKNPVSNISSNFLETKSNTSNTNTKGITLPGTNTIVERVVEKSQYAPYSLSALNGLRAELVALNASSVEYLKSLINRTEYKTAEVAYRSTSSGSASASNFSGTLSISNGGTGVSTSPAYGQLLLGNSSGGYDLVATSSLGISGGGASLTGTTGQLAYFSGTDTAVGTSTLFISTASKVGIGTATPGSVLDVVGSGRFSTSIFTGGATGGNFNGKLNVGGSANDTGWTFDTDGDGTGSTYMSRVYPGGSAVIMRASSNGIVFPSGDNVGIGTTTPGSLLSVGNINGINFSTATSTFSSTGGINLASGCFAVNGVCVGGSSYGDTDVNSYINGSSTIAKAYSTNVFTALNTFNGGLTISTLNGPLQANNGVVSATTSVGLLYGGTGATSASGARTNLGAAASGANSDITSLAGLTTALSTAQGGTGWGAIAANSIVLGNGTGSIATTSAGTNGQVLALVSGVPTWTATTTFSSGLTYSGGNVTLDNTGAWTGTFDGQEGSYYLNANNLTNFGSLFYSYFNATTTDALTQGATNKYYADALVNSYINGSSTIAKAYSTNVFTALNTFNGGLTISTLNGPLQANNGVVSATTSVGVLYGGTGLTSAPSYGNILVGNSSGGYTLTATSSLGIIGSQWNTSGSDIYYSTGKIGIGTTTLTALLSFNASTTSGGGINFGDSTANLYRSAAGTIKTDGAVVVTGILNYLGGSLGNSITGSAFIGIGNNSGIILQSRSFTAAGTAVTMSSGTFSNSSGQVNAVAITPTYNQTSTGAGTDLLINRTETAVGSGSQFLIDAQVGGVSKFVVTNLGNIGIGTTTPSAKFDVNGSAIISDRTAGTGVTTLTVKAGAGQSSTNLFDVQSSVGGTLFNVAASGTTIGNGASFTLTANTLINSAGLRQKSNSIVGWASATDNSTASDVAISRLSAGVISIGTGAAGNSGGTLIVNTVGIGTTTPSAKLAITGTAGTGDIFNIASSTQSSLFKISSTGALYVGDNAGTSGYVLQSMGISGSPQWVATSTLGISGGSSQWTTSGGNIYYATGNVGIGTTTAPTATLSLYNDSGTANIDFTSSAATLFTLGTDGGDNGNFKISTPSFGGNDVFVIASNVVSTSYSNSGGTGNRTGLITTTDSGGILYSNNPNNLINGSNGNGDWFVAGALSSSDWIKFDFGVGHPKVIQEATYTQQTSATQGVWQWQGSNDDSSWTDIGSSFTLGGATTDVITELSSNTVGYRYYRMLGVSGSTDAGPVVYQMDFKLTESTGGLPYIGINDVDPSAALDVTGWGSGTNFTFRTQNSSAVSTFVVLDNGNVGIGTTSPTLGPLSLASGAYVTTGGTWTNASDRNLKENFKEVDENSILLKISELAITQWNYKSEATSTMHIGPMAQDFFATFGLGGSNTSISTIDPAGIALLGIKAINLNLNTIASSTSSTTPASLSFASSFFDSIYRHIAEWMANAGNGIVSIFSKRVVTDELCVGSTCVTESQLQALLQNTGQSITVTNTTTESNTDTSGNSTTTTDNTSTTTDETVDDSGGGDSVIPEPDPAPEVVPEPETAPEPDPAPTPESTSDAISTP